MQPASREQIVAIIRQRAERHRDRAALGAQGAEGNPGAANGVPPPVPGGQFRLMGPGAGPRPGAPVFAGQGGLPRRPLPQAIVEFQDLVAAAAQPAPLRPLEPPPPGQDIGQMLMAQMVERADAMALRMQRDGVGGGAAIRPGPEELRQDQLREQLQRAQNAGEARLPMIPMFRQASISKDEDAPRSRNLSIQGSVVSYKPEQGQSEGPGVFVSGKPFSAETNYFELEIVDKGAAPHLTLSIGMVSRQFSLENLPGRTNESYAFCPGDGLLFRGNEAGSPFGGPRADVGDKVGCGIKFTPVQSQGKNAFPIGGAASGQLFFTHNSKEVGSTPVNIPPGGYFPAFSMTDCLSVVTRCGLRYIQEEDIMMMVDNCDDDWLNLHDIRLNGPVLEYIGRGKSLVDVGLAQAKQPISTRHHYFEIEIMDPGLRCYIAIGLARKDYPKNRHPGWNRGSIAYHADDGKVFVGSGVGAPFGPRCHKGDVMGCGVLFPRNYEYRSDSDDDLEPASGGAGGPPGAANDPFQAAAAGGGGGGGGDQGGNGPAAAHNFPHFDYPSDSADDEGSDWWSDRNYPYGVKVHIYFTRNGNVIGKREVRIPKGGFYPTVGMMSSEEKVRVDLRPLSG